MKVTIYNRSGRNWALDQFWENAIDLELDYLASDLITEAGFTPKQLELAIERSIKIFQTAHFNVRAHFKPIYICYNDYIISDWKLSALARQILILNGDPNNRLVALTQLEVLGNQQHRTIKVK